MEGLILLRSGLLNQVEVRAEERVARVGAGVKWGQVLAAAGPLGLTGLSGSAPGVSVTGFTLGGGIGWFSRKYGFASDSVRAIDIVDDVDRLRGSGHAAPPVVACRTGTPTVPLLTRSRQPAGLDQAPAVR